MVERFERAEGTPLWMYKGSDSGVVLEQTYYLFVCIHIYVQIYIKKTFYASGYIETYVRMGLGIMQDNGIESRDTTDG